MANKLTNTTFTTTYRDDFADSSNYHRILFNAGKALQARELTQMQTIINKEIERFGSNIFQEGASVHAGNITLNTSYEYIKLDTAVNPLPATPSTLVGKELTVKAPNPAIKFIVLEVVEASGSDPATLYVRYTDTSAATSGSTAIRVPNNAILEGPGITDLKVINVDATGKGTKLSIGKGDFFVQGHFVSVNSQSIFVDKYSNTPTANIVLKIQEDIVTVDDTNQLYDNQGDTPNIASPGADRYRIKLILSLESSLAADDNFVYLANIQNGKIVDQVKDTTSYNIINDVLALRTKEESGNYVVKPFIAKFNDLNDSNLQVEVSDGVAYVDGYRLDIPPSKITLPKAQDTVQLTSQTVIASYGNYVVGNASNNAGLPDVSVLELVNLRDTTNYGGSTIGTARVRAIQEDGANHNYYLFDIQMNSGSSFRAVKSFGTSGTSYVNTVLEDGIAVLKSANNNSLLFNLPNLKPSSTGVDMSGLTIQKKYQFTSDGSGDKTGLAAGSGFTFTDKFQWVVTQDGGAVETPTITLSVGDTQAAFTGLTPDSNFTLYAYVSKSTVTHKGKSLNANQTLTVAWPSGAVTDANGIRSIDLGTADIYRVTAIKQTDSDGGDLSTNFIVDNGQRDNFYAKGRLIERGGATIPTGNIYIKFDHFTHGAGGDYFSVNSYDGVVNYKDIPNYTKSNGETVNLRDVLDFRPVQDTSGSYTGTQGVINPLPQNTDAITGTIEYYMPRNDRLVAQIVSSRDTRYGQGSLNIVRGVSSLNPQYPGVPTGSIPLYDISLNAYTLNDSDLATSFYANKRYTMKDISRLEDRLDDLQELTTLSLLELNTTSVEVLDSAGLSRTKAGFLADNFSNYAYSATNRSEYRAAIDDVENTLSCQQYPSMINLFFDSTNVTNTAVLKGDNLVLPYTHVTHLNQNLATEFMNVNPFSVVTQTGHITISPETDAWVETVYAPDRVVDGGTITRNVGTRNTFNNLATWRNSWFGRPAGRSVQVVTGSRVIRELVGERVVDVQFIPFMRSVKVYFKAQGMLPNTNVFPFFGDTAISNYTRQEDFVRFSRRNEDAGNTYNNLTSHPDGSTGLLTDSSGEVSGSFIIPSNSALKFRTGQQIFKLLDISANNEADAISVARKTFASTGVIETIQRTIRSTRQLDLTTINQLENQGGGDGGRDPLAQSFRVDAIGNPSGVFISKVDIFFATKSTTGIPVELQIRTVENGIPTGVAIPGATKFLNPSEVNIPANTKLMSSVVATPTTFEFDEPIYLAPGQEYALVVLAESTEYNVYVAKTYDFILGSTEARVNKQPTLGTLFASQNARTWTPDQTRDLMFTIHRANFSSSAVALIENTPAPMELLQDNPFLTTSGDSDIRVFHEGHGFLKNDRVLITGLDSATYAGIPSSAIIGTRVITEVDHTGYKFGAASGNQATNSLRVGGSGIIVSKQAMYNSYLPLVETLQPENVSISASVKLTEGASFGDLQGGRNEDANGAYAKDGSYSNIALNEVNITNTTKLIASDSNETLSLSGNKSFTLKLDLSTDDPKVSPVIDLQRAQLAVFENIIDNQDSASADGYNIPISFVAETHPTDGSSIAKHITNEITLQEDAVGLKIIFAANRPPSSDFKVYYKASASDAGLDTVNYVEVVRQSDLPTDTDKNTYRQYEYLAGGIGGSLSPFTKFQVKIVFTSTNASNVPTIKDLRVIALAT